jgi:hypothetical protein
VRWCDQRSRGAGGPHAGTVPPSRTRGWCHVDHDPDPLVKGARQLDRAVGGHHQRQHVEALGACAITASTSALDATLWPSVNSVGLPMPNGMPESWAMLVRSHTASVTPACRSKNAPLIVVDKGSGSEPVRQLAAPAGVRMWFTIHGRHAIIRNRCMRSSREAGSPCPAHPRAHWRADSHASVLIRPS